MSPDLVLDLSLIAIGLLATYASWFATRDSCFQLEIINIRNEMDRAQLAAGGASDPTYRSLREDLNRLIKYAPYLSIPICFLYQRRTRKQPRATDFSASIASHAYLVGGDDAPPGVKRAFGKALNALIFHVVLDPVGLGLIAFLAISRRNGDFFGDLLRVIRSALYSEQLPNPAKSAS